MMAIYADRETVKYVGDSEPITLEECTRWIEVTDKNFEKRGYGMVGFESPDSGTLIACAGIVHPGQQPEAELKYAIHRNFWGQGYATEACNGLIRHARENWGITELIATVNPDNRPSQHVLSKLGFHIAELREEDGDITQVWRLNNLKNSES